MITTEKNIITIPSVKEKAYSYDLISKLLEKRIVQAFDEVTSDSAQILINQLLYLDSVDDSPINMYINSGGGSVHDGLAVVNTIASLKSEVHTTVVGLAASMGAVYLMSGAKGHRKAMKHSHIMIHQVSAGARGSLLDMEKSFAHTKALNNDLKTFVKERTNLTTKQLNQAFDRDTWLTAQEAIKMGVVDGLIEFNLR